MDSYASISKELNKFFSQHSFFKILLPLDIILYLGARIYSILQVVPIIGDLFIMGAPFSSVVYYLGIIGMLLTYANRKDQLLAVGFFLVAFVNVIDLIRFLVKYGIFSSASLIDVAIYGLIGLLILRRSYKNDMVVEG